MRCGNNLVVTDGITTVDPTTEVDFTSGATVTDLGGGVAGVAVGSAGISTEQFSLTSTTGPAGGGLMPWVRVSGATLLSYTTPTNPTIVATGTYQVHAIIATAVTTLPIAGQLLQVEFQAVSTVAYTVDSIVTFTAPNPMPGGVQGFFTVDTVEFQMKAGDAMYLLGRTQNGTARDYVSAFGCAISKLS